MSKNTARFIYDPYSTHQPILYEALLRTSGTVVEFGCGEGSTKLLHRFCGEQNRQLFSFDNNRAWLNKYLGYTSPLHKFAFVENIDRFLAKTKYEAWRHCDVLLVDQSPMENRYEVIQALKSTAKFIVLHDCDFFPGCNIFGQNIAQLDGARQIGCRTYDIFKYWKEFFPLEPWPHAQSGPPTLLASDFESCDWDIDFRDYETLELLR